MKEIVWERVETQSQIDTLCAIAEKVWHETFEPILPPGQTDYMIDKFEWPVCRVCRVCPLVPGGGGDVPEQGVYPV